MKIKLEYKGPIIAITGGLLGIFADKFNTIFKDGAGIFFFIVGFFLVLAGANMILTYHNSKEYKQNKEKKQKQPWE